jgi:hypothetical protein
MFSSSTGWRTTFQALRQEFQKAADANPKLRHFIIESLDDEASFPPHWQQILDQSDSVTIGLMTAPWDERRQTGFLYGPAEQLQAFERLAERAWLALPGTPGGKGQVYPQLEPTQRWLAFVYRREYWCQCLLESENQLKPIRPPPIPPSYRGGRSPRSGHS